MGGWHWRTPPPGSAIGQSPNTVDVMVFFTQMLISHWCKYLFGQTNVQNEKILQCSTR